MRHKMLLQADMKVPEEWGKISGGKTKDTLAAYYNNFIIETAKNQSNMQQQTIFISDGLKDRAIKVRKTARIRNQYNHVPHLSRGNQR